MKYSYNQICRINVRNRCFTGMLLFFIFILSGCASGESEQQSGKNNTESVYNFTVVLNSGFNEKDLLEAFRNYKTVKFTELYSEKHYTIIIRTSASQEEVIRQVSLHKAVQFIEPSVPRSTRGP